MELDPIETFRQEAAELLDSLETVLLDLSQTPQNRDLIDAAFRALHTIKGSGAMFGFDKVEEQLLGDGPRRCSAYERLETCLAGMRAFIGDTVRAFHPKSWASVRPRRSAFCSSAAA